MQAEIPEAARSDWVACAWDGLSRGFLVGAFAGLVDGLVRALGIDPAVFFYQVQKLGFGAALGEGLPQRHELLELAGCVGATMLHYALGAAMIGWVLAALHGLFFKGIPPRARRQRLLGLVLGLWLFVVLFWWTKPLLFPGRPITDPRRLATAAGFLVLGLVLGLFLARRAWPRGLARGTRIVLLLGVLGGGAYLASQAGSAEARGRIGERNKDLPNVLLIIVDALREDVLGPYGNSEVDTPHLDRMAKEGVVFENAFAQAPFTWPSFGSILTGKYPRRHGLIKMAAGVQMAPNVTLPWHLKEAKRKDGERLREQDFLCGAFITGTLSHGSGLLRGFDTYFEGLVGHEQVDVHAAWSEFRSGLLPWMAKNKVRQFLNNQLVTDTAVTWMGENSERRFMSLVHLYSTHTPYDPEDEFKLRYVDPAYEGPVPAFYSWAREAIERGEYEADEADLAQIRNLYYGGVSQADAMIGRMLEELERREVLDQTIVIVTSDHGESLGDRRMQDGVPYLEHDWMFETNLRIPLLVRYPKAFPAGGRVTARVDQIDLFPTVLDAMGLEPVEDVRSLPEDFDPQAQENLQRGREVIDGVSLLPAVRAETEQVRPHTFSGNGHYRSINDGRWKFICRIAQLEDGGWERRENPPQRPTLGMVEPPRLFDLEADPGERTNLFEEQPEKARELYLALKAWQDSLPIRDDLIQRSHRDLEREAAKLKALGYEGGIGEDIEQDE